nr:MAG TPA: hypothetical protein [Caudoviricetes sp.]
MLLTIYILRAFFFPHLTETFAPSSISIYLPLKEVDN